MAILTKLEQEVVNALMSKGRSESEANSILNKIKKGTEFKGEGEIEVSSDGRLVALYPVTGIANGKTGKSVLVEWNGQELWFPNGQIDASSEVNAAGDCGIMVVTKWIADKKGLLVDDKPLSKTQTCY